MVEEMIRYLEKDEGIKVDAMRDNLQIVFDKRTHRYIFFFNVQYGDFREDLMVYESSKMGNIRNSTVYDPEALHPLVKYCYHYRETFLEENGLTDKAFCIQKQLFPLYNNVIAELRRDNEGQRQLIVAYEQPLGEEGEVKMHLSIDDAQIFINVFHGIDPEQNIQFL